MPIRRCWGGCGRMDLRAAVPEDVDMLARLHVTSWAETYPGLLPDAEIARFDLAFRQAQWARILQPDPSKRVFLVPEAGFAVMGPQREAAFAAEYPEELYSLYVLQSAQRRGIGRALLSAVRSAAAFSASVVVGNVRAERFYSAQGGVELFRTSEMIGAAQIEEVALGFAARPAGILPLL